MIIETADRIWWDLGAISLKLLEDKFAPKMENFVLRKELPNLIETAPRLMEHVFLYKGILRY